MYLHLLSRVKVVNCLLAVSGESFVNNGWHTVRFTHQLGITVASDGRYLGWNENIMVESTPLPKQNETYSYCLSIGICFVSEYLGSFLDWMLWCNPVCTTG